VSHNLVKTTANKNRIYWSPLCVFLTSGYDWVTSCLVKEQEEEDAEHLLLISSDIKRPKVKNKIAEK
jgi:hypothetical protein